MTPQQDILLLNVLAVRQQLGIALARQPFIDGREQNARQKGSAKASRVSRLAAPTSGKQPTMGERK